MQHLEAEERRVEEWSRAGRKQDAVKLLFEIVVEHARAKRFEQAEAVRERLMAVDDMALDEIIRWAEIIEAEQAAALDEGHLKTWSHLYDSLSPEDTNALFFSMEERHCEAGAMVVRQGDPADRVVLLDNGQLKLCFRQGEDIRLIQTIEPGMISCQESLLARTVFTASLAAQTPSTLRVLPADKIRKWKIDRPTLHSRLTDFCEKTHRVAEILSRNRLDRRASPRAAMSGPVQVQVLDDQGEPIAKPFRGELDNLSSGGLAYFIKATAKAAEVLLHRNQRVVFGLQTEKGKVQVKGTAHVVAVKDRHFGDYSVHCRLLTPVPDRFIAYLKAKAEAGG
jgi:CRP-like cAMP-binding protein